MAMKMSFQYFQQIGIPQKKRFMAFTNAYHGETIGALSVGACDLYTEIYKPILLDVVRVDAPDCFRCPYGKCRDNCACECFEKAEQTFEKYGNEAQAAIILFTPDDIGKAKTEDEEKKRGRQNVVFEAGYFMGLLGRRKTMLIVSDNKIELPGDLSGVVYSDDSNEYTIAKELKAMGLQIDMNSLLS